MMLMFLASPIGYYDTSASGGSEGITDKDWENPLFKPRERKGEPPLIGRPCLG